MQAQPSLAAQSARHRFLAHWSTAALLRIAAGIGAGCCLAVVLWAFWAQWGTTVPVTGGLTLAVVVALISGLRASQWRHTFQYGRAPLWCGLAVTVATAPIVAAATLDALRWTPVGALEQTLIATSLAGIAALLCVGPTISLLCVLIAGPRLEESSGIADPCCWTGIALGLAIVPQTIALTNGLQQLGWLLSGVAVALSAVEWRRSRFPAQAQPAAPITAKHKERRYPWDLTDLGHLISGTVIGVSCALSLHMSAQLQAGMVFVVFASLSGLLGGIALGLGIRSFRGAGRPIAPEHVLGAGILLSVVNVAVLESLFGSLVDLHLWLSATVSSVWLLMPIRACLAALPLVPCGLALVIVTDERPYMVRGHFRGDLSTVACACAAGFLLFRSWGPQPADVLPWFELFGCGVSLLFLRVAALQTHLRRRAIAAASIGIVMAGAGIWLSDYDPARAARLLFSTNTFAAYRNGVDSDTLAVLDDGRLAATRSNGRTTWTVWKHHGAQLQFRENGIPRHVASVDLAVCPQSSSELLPAVAPLVMHPQPRHVLLTGLGSTATLQSCLAFPVETITCTEADPALVSLATSLVAQEATNNGLDDPRVRLLSVDAPLNAAAGDRSYDVIIVAATQPALFSSASTSTTDYFRRLARKLQPGGILCQRFQYVDFGAAPLRDMAATLRAVFPQVRLLESAPGEVLLLASMEDGPAVDSGLAIRAQSAHVRRVMSQAGWDWSVLLGLAAVDTAATDEMITEGSRANAAADGRFAFGLAPEVMRWGPKLEEIRQLLAERSSQMLKWIGPCTETEDAAKRLADVGEQQRIIHENPEQFWAYRKSLKERLQSRPRSVIVPVSHEGLQRRLHPEDERRKQYLVALGDAARQAQPDTTSIRRVADFVDPYDPLVSFFAHHEAAYLLSRSAEPDRKAELAHRLHTVYFGAGTDRSVRNVTASLMLLIDCADSAGSPQARWDDLNALLDVLKQRWEFRLQAPERSRYAGADISESLTAARTALGVMDELASELAVDPDAWQRRRNLLERQLVRPLNAAQLQQAERPQPRARAADAS